MRISTYTYLNAALLGMREQQSGIARLSAQLAADRRILQPKDDPIASSRALDLSASIARRVQYASNQQRADLALDQESTVLNGLSQALEAVRGLLVGGVAAANDLPLRQRYATEMSGFYLQVKDLANSQDSSGHFLFAGHRLSAASLQAPNTQAPFEHIPTASPGPAVATTYGGDANIREVRIGDSARVQVSDDLNATVMRAGTADDLLQRLDQIVIDLADPNLAQATLNNHLAAVNTAIDSLRLIQADVAARQTRLAEEKTLNDAQLNLDRDALGKLQELDQAAAIVELRRRETALQAAEQSFARVAGLSLFNFL